MEVADLPAGGPVAEKERIHSLDVLRGFAVLGILVMNIQSFAMISHAYFNPTAYGSLEGIHFVVWVVSHVFADMKFMALFSMLFGAGVVLFATRAEAKGRSPAGLHYRRTGWLILFGLLHAHLLWYGDILYAYGICALVVYLFRKRTARTLLILGLLLLVIGSGLYLFFDWSIPYWGEEQYQASVNAYWQPTEEVTAAELATFRGSWSQQMAGRVPVALMMETFVLAIFTAWRAGGLMLIGMALFKWKVLAAERSSRFYSWMMALGFGLGIPIVVLGVVLHFQHQWAYDYSFFQGIQLNYWGSVMVAAGYIALVMRMVQSGRFTKLSSALAATGRVAFTCYILQTVICTTIFYGHGLGLYGKVDRLGQALLVVAISVLQLVLAPLYLKKFRFGPLEWLWRTLTYWRIQPFKA
jgi:uncharacterized protein